MTITPGRTLCSRRTLRAPTRWSRWQMGQVSKNTDYLAFVATAVHTIQQTILSGMAGPLGAVCLANHEDW